MTALSVPHTMAVDAVALLLLFAVGGKLASGVGAWRRDLDRYVVVRRIPGTLVRHMVWAVPSAELLLGLALLLAPSRPVLASVAGLFAAFGAVLALEIRGGRAGDPCVCFGSHARATVSWQAVTRNLVVAGVASGLAVLSPAVPPPTTATRLAAFGATVSIAVSWLLWSATVRTRQLGSEQLAGMGVDRRQLRAIQAERTARSYAAHRTAESGT